MVNTLETIDFGKIKIVKRNTITQFDNYVTSINVEGFNDCDIYELAEGYCVAVLD